MGDLHIRRRFKNAYLNFKGSTKHEEYIRYLYSLFSTYCGSEPKIRQAKLGDNIHYSIWFDTLTNPLFNYYHELFYKDKTKIVPDNIGSLLTARGLAFWAQDDGTPDRSGFVLQTNNYAKIEVELLIKTLKLNFDLNCSLHTRKETSRTKEAYTIYIKSDSFQIFVDLVSPFFHPSMKYKFIRRANYVKKQD